jgi:predicted ATP-grasp superfamily ATP-dependent carboligase
MLIATQEQVDLVSKLLALNVIIQRQFTTLRGLLVDVWVAKSILIKKISLWRYKLMPTYSVIVNETVTYAVELEAQSEDEAIALVNKDINKYEIVSEEVTDWQVDYAEEV